MSTTSIYVGLDAGSSSTALWACPANSSSNNGIERTGPAANAQRLGPCETARTLVDLIQDALDHYTDARLLGIGAGISGAGSSDDRQAIVRHMRDLLGDEAPDHIRVEHDAHIALEAAFDDESGIIVIAGTGSVTYARQPDQTVARAGGWGHLVGDEGSGYVLGRAGIRAVAHAYDGGPSTQLVDLVSEQCDVHTRSEIIHRIYREEGLLQDAAPLVLKAADQNDGIARRILESQTDMLARQVKWLRDRCATVEPRIVLFGGLSKEPIYVDALRDALNRHLPDCHVRRSEVPPVAGALKLARQPVK